MIVCCVDGELSVGAAARVPVTDRGFLFGDGVFEVLRTSGGVPVDLDGHLARLADGLARLGIAAVDLTDDLARVLAATTWPDSHLRLVVTRGDDDRLAGGGHAPRRVIIARPLELPGGEAYATGLRLLSSAQVRLEPAVKGLSYLASVLALREVRARGGDEALLVHAGQVLEGASANFFAVLDGVPCTPALGAILPGVTRARLIALLAEDGVTVQERPLGLAELAGASEAFVTSSIRGVMPVASLDGRGLGVAGELTTRATALYAGHLAALARQGVR